MKNLNNYIIEAWSGVKKQSLKAEIKVWCDEMGIESYTINSKGEIDVKWDVDLRYNDFEELPYKFGKVGGYFNVMMCLNLKTLKNCPNEVGGYFSCSGCINLNSLEGCPKEVKKEFYCYKTGKKQFNAKDILKYCNVDPEKIITKTT